MRVSILLGLWHRAIAWGILPSGLLPLLVLLPSQRALAQCECIVWAGATLCELPDGANPLVGCPTGCDSDFDGIVDINDLESFLIDSMDCAGFQGPPPPEWLEDVIEYFIGRCGGCPGFDIDIEDIIDLLFRYYPGPIPPEIIDNIADLLNPPGEITPPVELPDNPPEIGDGSDGGGGGGDWGRRR